jgi:23S rRNA (guanosine2251-2'-O)-methyltransferase
MSDERLVCGIHPVASALKRKGVVALWVQADRRDARTQEIIAEAERQGLTLERVGRDVLERMVPGARTQGVVAQLSAAAEPLPGSDLEAILARHGRNVLLLVLDGVQDPHNLGACLRTADAAGVHAVLAPKDRAVGLTPVVRKVASGAAEALPFIVVTNLARTLRQLRDAGVSLVGTTGEAELELYDADLRGPLALVMGAEGAGMRRLTAELCDQQVRIPMAGSVESLNVSVATGVCLYEVLRQRRRCA